MRRDVDLQGLLQRVDGRGYKAYQSIAGEYAFSDFTQAIDHVQGDPFASPSRLRARVPQKLGGFPSELYATPVRRIALQDYLARRFAAAVREVVKGNRGTGHSGLVAIDAGGQEILERTSCLVTADFVEARFVVGLPAAGRTCLGREAAAMLLEEVPKVVRASLFYAALNPARLRHFIAVAEDQEALRAQLSERRLVALVADGSILPRASGVSDRPLTGAQVIPFESPPELRVELVMPNKGPVTGMGIPEGVTLIVGGGYHGKSTLLAALARGVFNHVPGDGREYIVTRPDAVKIRSEDGRRIEKVDISPFITNLPFQTDTTAFCTENASGSTSQAANIVEALEYGTSLLLIDEDTSATNFMVRDARMQQLVPKAKEPITAFIDQVQSLYRELEVSTVLVMGGSSDYFEVADTVIMMDSYRPRVVTADAHRLVERLPTARQRESGIGFGGSAHRNPLPESIDPVRGGKLKVSARGLHALEFGTQTIALQQVEQLVDISQTRAIGEIIVYAKRKGYFDGRATLREALKRVYQDIAEGGLDVLSPFPGKHPGELARPRLQEVAQALNRLRSLEVRQAAGASPTRS